MLIEDHNPSSRYMLMLKDSPVCTVDYNARRGVILSLEKLENPELMPLKFVAKGTVSTYELSEWWQDRFAPKSRLPRTLQNSPEYAALFEASCGMSLSDHYWLKPQGSDITWQDKNFFTNDFSDVVGRDLLGTGLRSKFAKSDNLRTPSIAANGMLPKYWRVNPETGKRQLCKASSKMGKREAENEVAISKGFNELLTPGSFVPYRPESINGQIWSVCDNFLDENREYIPVCDALPDISMDEDGYEQLLNFAAANGVMNFERDLSMMLVGDALFANQDRHFGNFGFIRNVETLKIERMAPIFDNGTSLWCPTAEGHTFAPFSENVNTQLELLDDFACVHSSNLTNAVNATARELELLGIPSEEAERISDLLNYQADLILAEKDDRIAMRDSLESKLNRQKLSATALNQARPPSHTTALDR